MGLSSKRSVVPFFALVMAPIEPALMNCLSADSATRVRVIKAPGPNEADLMIRKGGEHLNIENAAGTVKLTEDHRGLYLGRGLQDGTSVNFTAELKLEQNKIRPGLYYGAKIEINDDTTDLFCTLEEGITYSDIRGYFY